jgi:hypothetical protein
VIILTIPVFDGALLNDWLARGEFRLALAGCNPSSVEEGLHPLSKSSNAVNIDL